MKKVGLQTAKYVFWDIIAAVLGYSGLFYYRKYFIEEKMFGVPSDFYIEPRFYLGLSMTALFWVGLYWITGFYKDIYRRSRLREIFQTFNSSLFGSVIIFFALILDDWVMDYKDYYQSFLVYFTIIFLATSLFRFVLSTRTNRRIQSRKIWFNTILIGSNERALQLFNDFQEQRKSSGQKFVGFVSVYEKMKFLIEEKIPLLGSYKELEGLIEKHDVEEVIIAVESTEHHKLEEIINMLEDRDVKIKMIPDMYDIISGQVRMESLGSPLVEVSHELMPQWQMVIKRLFDIFFSSLLLLLSSPVFALCILVVKSTSSGSIFFRQKRIGLHGKEFHILKFRSMYENAEEMGPQLSKDDDPRITPWGKIMRKYRMDELPQFFNVIIGEMSFVGPRPERQFYIDQIMVDAPHYRHVQKVKPGITSWGMVKFGYAENVSEMIERLKFDIIYIENMSLLNDIKILFYTVLIVLQGRGK